jgi:hypothetical protein
MYSRDKIIDTMKEIYSESRTIKPYVVIAQPRRDLNEKAAQNFDGYDGLHIDLMGFSHGYCNIGGEKVDVARNYLIEQTLESGAKYLLFVGEDTVLPYDGFKKLMKTAEENPGAVVTGVYYIKCSDAMIMTRENDWIVIPNVDPGQIIEAWQTGMDAMLIPVDLLKKMKEEDPELPFCCIGNNINDEIPFIGEDNFFVHRLHKRGTKLLVNTDVQCLHMDLASGMYTAHPSVDLTKYYTNIKPTRRLTMDDKEFIDQRWVNRLPDGTAYKSIIAHKIENKEPIRFNMGSGNDKLEGYLNVDKNSKEADIIIDVMKMDLPENVTEEILASHLIEHLPQHRAPEIISNWYRTLKPKGKLVVETPHIEELCQDFLQQDDEDRIMTLTCIFGAAAEEKSAETEERGALYPHLWGYTPKTLTDLCKSVGFKDVKILPQTGKHPGKNFRLEAVK